MTVACDMLSVGNEISVEQAVTVLDSREDVQMIATAAASVW